MRQGRRFALTQIPLIQALIDALAKVSHPLANGLGIATLSRSQSDRDLPARLELVVGQTRLAAGIKERRLNTIGFCHVTPPLKDRPSG